MSTKETKSERVIVRLEKDLYDFVKEDADVYEMKVSAYIRMLLRMSKNLVEKDKKNANR